MDSTQRRHRSVRLRLLIIALVPIVVVMPLLIAFMMERWISRTEQILLDRVNSDLIVAHQYLSHLIENTEQGVALLDMLPTAKNEQGDKLGLDFLLSEPSDTRTFPVSLLNEARKTGQAAGLAILSGDELARISPLLAERARITLADGGYERRGLIIWAAKLDDADHFTIGGVLLNNNKELINNISALVYPVSNPVSTKTAVRHMDRGIISLFLGNIRISTTATNADGGSAVGTQATHSVSESVLSQGNVWNERASVLGDWYFSAYEPLVDSMGHRVGMLYAGIPEAPYRAARWQTWSTIGAVFLVLVGFAIPLFLYWVGGIFRPIEAMVRTISRVDNGNMTARTGPTSGAEELTHLSARLDQLLDGIQVREADLYALNTDLNQRVAERTADLTRSNLALEAASRQLVLTEKLATIGEITAGMAHEINNPLAVMQGNLEILRMELAEDNVEVALIDAQIQRISTLVSQLLQFSKPEEFADHREQGCLPSDAVNSVRPLVRHMLDRHGTDLQIHTESHRRLRLNLHELQQVFVNLIANAAQAMPGGGNIVIKVTDQDDPAGQVGVLLDFSDTGIGMDNEVLLRIFDPFFTTRGRAGTGLGLPICQAIIARQNGTIRAESQLGTGSRFVIWLPASQRCNAE